jgi:hypothetical protein
VILVTPNCSLFVGWKKNPPTIYKGGRRVFFPHFAV